MFLIAGGASAATFTVNSVVDVPDDNPGDGVCHPVLAIPGVCTLRAAVQEANALPGADVIIVTPNQVYTLTRSGQDSNASSGDLDITDAVTIRSPILYSGSAPVLDAGGLERVFEIFADNVSIIDFHIIGGDATLPLDGTGGGVAIDFDADNVFLSLLRIHDNVANFGGGLYNDGSDTTLIASEIYDNRHASGPVGASGGGIHNRGTLRVERSALYRNAGLTGNTSTLNSTDSGVGPATLTVVNSTIADNTGNGLVTQDEVFLSLRNVTIADNSGQGLRILGVDGDVRLRNTVVANNTADDCTLSIAATYNTNGYNVDSDGSCDLAGGGSNFSNIDPRLTPLTRHDPITPTMWPMPDSPLIDAGHPVISGLGCEALDQRGEDRPVDYDDNGFERCDIGAVELQIGEDATQLFADGFE